jgi:hypothetical protein
MLTLAVDLCCVGFVSPISVAACVQRQETSSIYWAQLSRYHLKIGTDSSLQNVVLNEIQDDNIQSYVMLKSMAY